MFKKTHIKIIMIFFIIGIFLITSLGIVNILNLNNIKTQITDINTITQIEKRTEYLIKVTVILDGVYSLLCIIIAIIFSRILNKPIIK